MPVLQEGTSWQAALRSLCAVEAILEEGSAAACGDAAMFFQVTLHSLAGPP